MKTRSLVFDVKATNLYRLPVICLQAIVYTSLSPLVSTSNPFRPVISQTQSDHALPQFKVTQQLSLCRCSRLLGSIPRRLRLWPFLPPSSHVMLQLGAGPVWLAPWTGPLLRASELGRAVSTPCPLGLLFWLSAGSSWALRARALPSITVFITHSLRARAASFPSLHSQGPSTG